MNHVCSKPSRARGTVQQTLPSVYTGQEVMKPSNDSSGESVGVKFEIDPSRIQHQATIAKFTNGKLNPEQAQNVDFAEFVHVGRTEKNERRRKILVAETEQMEYVGHNFGPGAVKAVNYNNYYLGVRCRKTGKMALYEAEMFNLSPRLEADKSQSEDEEKEMTYREKTDQLTTAFGSSRMRRAMESRLKNKISGTVLETAVGSAVSQTLKDPAKFAALDTAAKAATGTDHSEGIPKFNRDGKTPHEVYQLKDIISDAEMEALKSPAQELVKATREVIQEWRKAEVYGSYVISELSLMPLQDEARLKRSCCLSYLHYMIHLHSLRAHQLKKKEIMPDGIPSLVKERLLQKFSALVPGPGGRAVRCIPSRLKDKLLSYILVLCLIINDFHLDCRLLQHDLKLGKKLFTHLRALGCKILVQKAAPLGDMPQSIATLPIPLTFPELSIKQKKQRR